ncbi:hypothetical protein M422DRAFT_30959 [Sphaerobolus stellatus SS14]|uniref:Uncharacterized protein n=1 Tax=Sphaerobolus stellatus (strain SS14) TaxID=990650 RepID=A0A0C9VWU6_SPHS4|nr:hypothetical protein M422DRAFT_30959 [Sphaerobolus stellatus SS14]
MEENTYHQYAYDDLVNELNALLLRLCLPITIGSPQDLTPSLLLAILESIIKERLPIPQTIRESNALDGKVLAMKLFLGVIETDILQRDLGLSNMDPRRLAAGELAEVVYIGRTLCLLGRDYLSFEEDVEENTGVVKVEENHISISRDRIVPNTRSSELGHLGGSIRSAIIHMPRGISSSISTRLSSPSQYTLALLKERASLLEELAKSR